MRFPGFVDLQVNGIRGVDFSSPELTLDDVHRAAVALRAAGTSAFLATIITSPPAVYERNLPILARYRNEAMERTDGDAADLLGIHLEGPYISPAEGAVGAHDFRWVLAGDPDAPARLMDLSSGSVRLLTVAAEIPGCEGLVAKARAEGIAVSLGHQMASGSEVAVAAEWGAVALTHFGNGLPHLVPRHTNPLWTALVDDRLTTMIISDGHHLPDPVVRVVLRCKPVSRVIIVSDASPLTGLGPGSYRSFGHEVVLEASGRISNPKSGYLVGSGSTMLDCANRILPHVREEFASTDPRSAFEIVHAMGYENPLRLIGVDPSEYGSSPTVEVVADRDLFRVLGEG